MDKDTAAPAHCQCSSCKDGAIHASDCAVHNAPALPVGKCDCGAAAPAQSAQSVSQADFYELLTAYGEACHLMTNSAGIEKAKEAVLNAFAGAAAPAQSAEPVAYFVNDNAPGLKPHYSQISEQFKDHRDVFAFYAAPQPSPTAVVLDDERADRYTMDQMRDYALAFHEARTERRLSADANETLHAQNVGYSDGYVAGFKASQARAASPQLVEKAAEYRDFNEFWSLNWGDFPRTEEADARRIWEVATGWKNGGSHD